MDDRYARYGFFSIYKQPWFVKRVDDSHVAISPAISSKAQSSATDVSLRECFLATAIRAADVVGSRYERRTGSQLIMSGTSRIIVHC